MSQWRSRLFELEGTAKGADPTVIRNAIAIAEGITQRNARVTPVFTLRHLAHLAAVDYGFLRHTVSRTLDPYRTFRIRKRLIPGETKTLSRDLRSRSLVASTATLDS